MKKRISLAVCLLMLWGFAAHLAAAPAVDLEKISVVVRDADGTVSPEAGTADQPFLVSGNKSYTVSYNGLETVLSTDETGAESAQEINHLLDVTCNVELVPTVFATIGSHDKVARSFPITFANTAFDYRTVQVNLTFSKAGTTNNTLTLHFKVTGRTAENIYSEANAISDFGSYGDIVNLDTNIEQITAGALQVMQANTSRSLVYKGNDFILTFDRNSENLDQDIEVRGNCLVPEEILERNPGATLAAVNLPLSTATASFEVAVSSEFAHKFENIPITVYTKAGERTDIQTTLVGTIVKFTAPLGSYILTGDVYRTPDGVANFGQTGTASDSDTPLSPAGESGTESAPAGEADTARPETPTLSTRPPLADTVKASAPQMGPSPAARWIAGLLTLAGLVWGGWRLYRSRRAL